MHIIKMVKQLLLYLPYTTLPYPTLPYPTLPYPTLQFAYRCLWTFIVLVHSCVVITNLFNTTFGHQIVVMSKKYVATIIAFA